MATPQKNESLTSSPCDREKSYGQGAAAGQAQTTGSTRAEGCLMRGIKEEARRLRWID